jgi:hypothetical protein
MDEGEMRHPLDRADPVEWGPLGWDQADLLGGADAALHLRGMRPAVRAHSATPSALPGAPAAGQRERKPFQPGA